MNMLRRARFHWLLFLGCLLTLIAVGCATGTRGDSTPTPPPTSPDKVDLTRFTTISGTKLPPLEITVTDRTRAQRLYQGALALPKFPANKVVSCPIDYGVEYHLDFSQGNTTLMRATLDASGCRALHFSKSDVRQTNDAFFSLLAQEMGVPSATLLATPQTSP